MIFVLPTQEMLLLKSTVITRVSCALKYNTLLNFTLIIDHQ